MGVLAALGLAAALFVWWAPLPARLSAPPSTVVRYRDGQPATMFLAPDDRWRLAADPQQVDPAYLRALLALEDRRFRLHPGVDPIAVVRAASQDLAARRVVSGASTLTMQLVRVLEPRPRTLRSKLIEALRAMQIELHLSKPEILAAYLSFVPFGRNLEGVEAASWAMFGHGPEQLSDEEIVTLLAIPQDPCARYPRPRNQARLRQARIRAAERLVRQGVMATEPGEGPALLARVRGGPQPTALRAMPREAPHASRWLRDQAEERSDVVTSLDRGAQLTVESILARARAELGRQGIHDVAVVVVDHTSTEIRALVGGFDFYGRRTGAQMAAFDVPRSPGSTLKPVLLARALDLGLALPGERVLDLPRRYGSYEPRNYGGEFQGAVRLDEALSQSLNLPFIDLMDRVGVQDMLGVLRSAGVHSLHRDPARYGLSLAVGGAELTPLELAGIYTTLAQGGQARALRWTPGRPGSAPGVAVLSPGATWLVRRILEGRDRPDFPQRAELRPGAGSIHWKTGTSAAHRDAWAAGSDARYTVVVWLGNLDGQGSAHLVGGLAAAPLLFDLLEALDPGDAGSGPSDSQPEDLVPIRVCSLSGLPAGPHCPHAVDAWVPRGAVQARSCALHVEVEIDVVSGEQVGPGCRAGRETRREVHTLEPGELRRWRAERYGVEDRFPALAPGCEGLAGASPPAIVRPTAGTRVVLAPGLDPADQELRLVADYERPGDQLRWFVDGRLVGTAQADGSAWWRPEPGRHELMVLTASGAGDRRWVEVVEL